MKKINSVAIIGLGAVGAVVGDQIADLVQKGTDPCKGDFPGTDPSQKFDLFCILDEKRKARYEKDGIWINDEKCNFTYVTPEELKPVDLIIIATKNLQIEEAIKEIKNGVGPDTMILSLLNGIQSEKDIAAVYGEEKTLYGFIIDLQSINLGGKITCYGKGKIVFGEKDNSKSERVQAVCQLFDEAGIKYDFPENIQLAMWKKFLINTVFNSLGAICRTTYGGFRFDVLKDAARKIGYEVISVANAEGIPLTKELLEEDIKMNLNYNPLGKCSMLQDMEAERKTENQYFCGTICKLGKLHGIPTPYCEFLEELIEGTELARTLRF